MTLKGHRSRILSLAFRPDGVQVATGGEDGEALLWDAPTEAAPAHRDEREALGLVETVLERPGDPQEASKAVLADPSICDAVRRRSLDLLARAGRAEVEQEAAEQVATTKARSLSEEDGRFRLCAHPLLPEAVRLRALEMLRDLDKGRESLRR